MTAGPIEGGEIVRVGICGVRGMGVSFAHLLVLHPDLEEVHVADLNLSLAQTMVDQYHATSACTSFDRLCEMDLDAIAIFTPPWVHASQAVQALEAGKHVMSACPVGLTLEECRDVVNAVERTGRIYMTAETSYYYPATIFCREAWANGRFGEFIYGEGEYYYRPHAYDFWMRDAYANMPPMLYASHSISMIVGTIGRRLARVTCVGTPGLHPDAAAFRSREPWTDNQVSNMTMLAQVEGGGVARINEMRNVGCSGDHGSILGTLASVREHSGQAVWDEGPKGTLVDLTALWQADPQQHPQASIRAKLPAEFEQHDRGTWHKGTHNILADEFVRAVRDNRRPHNHVWNAVKYCAPGIVAWESLKQGSAWLDVPDFGEPTDGRAPLEW